MDQVGAGPLRQQTKRKGGRFWGDAPLALGTEAV